MHSKKFRKLVRYASTRSPYYQKIIKSNHINVEDCVPEDFPVLTKIDVIENFDNIVTDPRITKPAVEDFLSNSKDPTEQFLDTYYVTHSSGTSGTMGYSLFTEEELIRGAVHFTRVFKPSFRMNYAYVGPVKSHFGGATMSANARHLPLYFKKVRLFDINSPFQDILTELQTLQPTILSGYPFAIRKIAEAQQEGTISINPKVIMPGGQSLFPKDKTYIEKVFNIPVFNVYAASENLIMGIEKDSYGGMYLMEDDLIFELHQKHTYLTNLYRYTMPLIRYEMWDCFKKVPDSKHVFPFLKVELILGRDELVPIFVNDHGKEDSINSDIFVKFNINGISSYQFHLLSKTSFVLLACLEKGLNKQEIQSVEDAASERVRAILREKNMNHVNFEIKIVDHLSADAKTGKFKLIIKDY